MGFYLSVLNDLRSRLPVVIVTSHLSDWHPFLNYPTTTTCIILLSTRYSWFIKKIITLKHLNVFTARCWWYKKHTENEGGKMPFFWLTPAPGKHSPRKMADRITSAIYLILFTSFSVQINTHKLKAQMLWLNCSFSSEP